MNIIITRAKRGKRIDDVLKSLNTGVPETFKEPTRYPSVMSDLIRNYAEFLVRGPYDWLDKNECGEYKSQYYSQLALKPDEINAFLQGTIVYQNNPYYSELTGDFITELMRKSYEKGHRQFLLDTRNTIPIEGIVQKLYAQDKRLSLEIRGDVGRNLGYGGTNLDITVFGNVNPNAAEFSRDCTFVIHGLAPVIGVSSQRIVMKTSNSQTFLGMATVRKFSAKDCRGVAFIHPDGREEWAR